MKLLDYLVIYTLRDLYCLQLNLVIYVTMEPGNIHTGLPGVWLGADHRIGKSRSAPSPP